MQIVVQQKEKWWQSVLSDCFTFIVLTILVFLSAYFDQRGFEAAFIFTGLMFLLGGKSDRIKVARTKGELDEITKSVKWED